MVNPYIAKPGSTGLFNAGVIVKCYHGSHAIAKRYNPDSTVYLIIAIMQIKCTLYDRLYGPTIDDNASAYVGINFGLSRV